LFDKTKRAQTNAQSGLLFTFQFFFFEDFTAIYLDFGASHLPKFTFLFSLGFTLFRPKLLILPLRGSLFLFFKNIGSYGPLQIGNFKFYTLRSYGTIL
jgi:hypothetical protein